MMTIDEMLARVAEEKDITPSQPKSEKTEVKRLTISEPVKAPDTYKSESVSGAEPLLLKRTALSLAISKEIACCIERAAEKTGVRAVIAIAGCEGVLICLNAMDNSYAASIKAAQDKAYTAAALKMPTHTVLKESRGGSLDGLTNGNGILMLAGGMPITYRGEVIGAVGVSGGTKDEDMLLAEIGIAYFNERIKR